MAAETHVFRTLLTKEEYVKLCEMYYDKKGNMQVNYYFDTPRFTLKASDIGLRVRKREKYELTLKRKKGYVNQEINNTISSDDFKNLLSTGLIPDQEIATELEDVLKEQLLENYMSLSTFRISVQIKSGKIAIDKCVYVDKKDYELEYETSAPYEQAKKEFVEMVKEFGIQYKKGLPKIKRAYEALRNQI